MLHYVACSEQAIAAGQLLRGTSDNTEFAALVKTLAPQCLGLLPGFHRFLLDQGRLILTLCIGDTLKLLRQQQFAADEIYVSLPRVPEGSPGDNPHLWLIKALARCCRRGSALRFNPELQSDALAWSSTWTSCGFVIGPAQPDGLHGERGQTAVFDPPWPIRRSRQADLTCALPVQTCAVVGAGLAGAAVAAALARRGWQVRVLDQADKAASGASGLPAGLVLAHVSSDDCQLSRLSRAGVRLMLQQARQFLTCGQDWAPSGVLERQVGGTPQLPKLWAEAGHDWTTPGQAMTQHWPGRPAGDALWHPQGAWIKPAALVRCWLQQPGVQFLPQAQVAALRRDAQGWVLLDASGNVICQTQRVVLANACGAKPLLHQLAEQDPELAKRLQRLPTSQGMRGLLSWGLHPPGLADGRAFPPLPVNGSGSVIAQVPHAGGTAWYIGSSYQPEAQPQRADADNHARNFAHLQQLLPDLATDLREDFARLQVHTWKGTRCVTSDRLPLVGPLDGGDQPELWLCAGLGSRGLSFSVLCAELLAARMGAEPLPIEAPLARALDALRA
jgi:tRNA 5-methylaminomethyl-2-thiouridine biosynthesis bifunctional protein